MSKMARLSLCIFFLLSLLLPVAQPGSQPAAAQAAIPDTDWPMYQHDAGHSGRTPATAYNSGPLYLQWAYSFGERVEVEAQPVFANGVAYQGVMNGEMHAINAVTGVAVWIKRYGGPIPHTAAVDGSRVYYGSLDGSIYALEVNGGNLAWSFQTGGPVISAPAIVNNIVYIGSNDGSLYALNAATGQKVWSFQTGGPVVSSAAVANGRVYFGSEDLFARAVNAASGTLIWSLKLSGAGMHNTHPVLADDGSVVMFVTVKPGASSYVPYEDYPNTTVSANVVNTWNTYYQKHPTYRTLYYLNAATGADLWNPATQRYVPLPIPYWGVIHPILGPDGYAWFPAPSGALDPAKYIARDELDHDSRLFKVNLATGEAFTVAGEGQPEFQLRSDEVGRHSFGGNDYYYAISEDLGVFKPSTGSLRALFSNGTAGGYNFGSHMNPLSPLPDLHLWRYGGTVSMGGVPGAGVPIVANGLVYYSSYGWLYAVGQTNRGYNPATSFPARDSRRYELTYPRDTAPTTGQIRAEIDTRVADILALGPANPPVMARWEQTQKPLVNNEFKFELYGYEADLVRTLAEAYPYLSVARKAALKTYLDTIVTNKLLNPAEYVRNAENTRCLVYGEPDIQSSNTNCRVSGEVVSIWYAFNPNLVGLRLHALWAYASATGDWSKIQSNWAFINSQFRTTFLDASYCKPVTSYGYCIFEQWRTGRLNVPAQVAAAQAVRDMANQMGDSALKTDAAAFLATLLDARVKLADFVPQLYDSGKRTPAPLRTNPDGTINNIDLMGSTGPYNHDMIAYSAALRDRDTDMFQVNWWDGTTYRIDAGLDFAQYQALSGYFPMTGELAKRLRTSLLEKTRYYVKSYEVNSPWWWMADLAHHTTGSGEHLYTSPTLSWSLFQTKAYVLQEDWNTLVHELPEPVSFNSRYDLYRLENLSTLMELAGPNLAQSSKTASSYIVHSGGTVNYTISILNTGNAFSETVTLTDTIPTSLTYVPGSLHATSGVVNDTAAPTLTWSGVMNNTLTVTITYSVNVTLPQSVIKSITNTAAIESTSTGILNRSATIMANSRQAWIPVVRK